MSKAWSKLVTPKTRQSRSVVVEEGDDKPVEDALETVDPTPRAEASKSKSLLSKMRKSMGTPRRGRKSLAAARVDESDPFGVENVPVPAVLGDLMTFTPSPATASRSKRKSVVASLAASTAQAAASSAAISNPSVNSASAVAATDTPRRSKRLSYLL